MARAWPLAVLVALLAAACAGPPDHAGPAAPPPPLPDSALVAEVVAAHNRRVGQLARTASVGVIEYRWTDEQGAVHEEPQVNARLWIELPRRTALRAEKLGDVVFWLGSDAEQYWMFDLVSEPSYVIIGALDDAQARRGLLVHPLALVDLLGLTPLPVAAAVTARFGGRTADRLVLEADGAGGRMRITFDGRRLPILVESLDDRGEVVLASELEEYRSVIVEGIARTALPRMPGRIDITDTAGTMAVKLALGETETESSSWSVVFDLERITRSLRPREVLREGSG